MTLGLSLFSSIYLEMESFLTLYPSQMVYAKITTDQY